MNRPLTGCTLAGPFNNVANDFASIAASLRYQASMLGLNVISTDEYSNDLSLSFKFETSRTSLVSCDIARWSDASKSTCITENIIQAACGIMSVHGRVSGEPRPLGLQYVSTLTGALALQGCFAAALGRLRGMPVSGSNLSVSSAALLSVSQYLADATAAEMPDSVMFEKASRQTAPPFMSSDGVCFELETLDVEPWQKFWAQFGINSALSGKGWSAFLLRYARAISPLPVELVDALSNYTFQHISEVCARTGMSICQLRSVEERQQDEHFMHDWLQGPWSFEFNPNVRARTDIKKAENQLPLSGLTVIESCRRIQGPLAGHLLTLLGADVIRIEPPGGDPLRGMPPMADGCSARFDALNRLKTIREINIKSAAGRAEIKELVQSADVFLHNWAPDKAAQLGLDYSDFVDLNPALIYAYAAGWSTNGSAESATNTLPGTDFMTQAYSGVARKISQASGTRGGSLFTVLDVLGGVIAAQGITAALLKRHLDNASVKVTSSLLSAATLLCIDDFPDKNMLNSRIKSKSIINGVFDTKQGKLAIECPDLNTVSRLRNVLEIANDLNEIDFHQFLQLLLLTKTAEEWLLILERAGVPVAQVIEDLATIRNQAHLQQQLSPDCYTKVMSPWSFK
ncbi:CoA transferase [Nitrosomonas marina]|nr:CoA transferase [Nitrosomonas marina]